MWRWDIYLLLLPYRLCGLPSLHAHCMSSFPNLSPSFYHLSLVVSYTVSLWWVERDFVLMVIKTVRRAKSSESEEATGHTVLPVPAENNFALNDQPTSNIL